MPKKWIPLESNPEVITDFASRIGLDTQQWAFHDVFGLDEEVKQQQLACACITFAFPP
jgi:ubiquitin carboxyl-terminal hydrolase L3